jgi:hypothetical protein
MGEDVEALLELWEEVDPDPVDVFEDQLAADLGLRCGPGLSKHEGSSLSRRHLRALQPWSPPAG